MSNIHLFRTRFDIYGGEHTYSTMTKPLIMNRQCWWCKTSYYSVTTKKNKVCSKCSRDRTVLGQYVSFNLRFELLISNKFYMPHYSFAVEKIGINVIIGYISAATKIFFVGRIVSVAEGGFVVQSFSRSTKQVGLSRHEVAYSQVKCIFLTKLSLK